MTTKRKRGISSEVEEAGPDIFTVDPEDNAAGPSEAYDSQSDDLLSTVPKPPSWPGDFYVKDIVKFLGAVERRQNKMSVETVFGQHFPGTRFVPTTYYEHRTRWSKASPNTQKRFLKTGRTKEGLWSCFMEVVKDPRAEYKSAQKRSRRKKKSPSPQSTERDTPSPRPPPPPPPGHQPRYAYPPGRHPTPGPSTSRSQYPPPHTKPSYRQQSYDYNIPRYHGRYEEYNPGQYSGQYSPEPRKH